MPFCSRPYRSDAYAIAFAGVLFLAALAPTASGADLGGRLHRLFGQYQRLRSVSIKVVVQRTLNLPLIESGAKKAKSFTVVLRYKAAGMRYAISNSSNGPGGLGGHEAIAFDGNRFESLAGTYLWYERSYNGPTPVATGNVFFYPLIFADPSCDGHVGRIITLPYVSNARTEKKIIARATWKKTPAGPYSAIANIPGPGKMNKHRFFYRVFFGKGVDYLPARVEVLYRHVNGPPLWKYDLLAYGRADAGRRPFYYLKSYRRKGYLRQGMFMQDMGKVTLYAINKLLRRSDFTINFGLASTIYDADAKKIIFAAGGIRPPQRVIGITYWPSLKGPNPQQPVPRPAVRQPPPKVPVAAVSVPNHNLGAAWVLIFSALLLVSALGFFILRIVSRSRGRHG